jgi:hypothetical protein
MTAMISDQPPGETEAKSNEWLSTALAVLAGVLIPNVLHDTLRLPLSWGFVFGIAVASTLAYFLLPAPKKNVGRFVQISLAMCVVAYVVGRFLG